MSAQDPPPLPPEPERQPEWQPDSQRPPPFSSPRDQLCLDAILHFGIQAQIVKAIEELTELRDALICAMNGSGNVSEVIDEIADVRIMIAQLRMIYGDAKIEERIDYKLSRLEKMIQK